jgi:hypothetical protein
MPLPKWLPNFFATLILLGSHADAITIDSDTFVDFSVILSNVVVVDGISPPTRFFVVPGGSVDGTSVAIDAYDSSRVGVFGGRIQSGFVGVRLNDDARLQIVDGQFVTSGYIAEAHDRGRIRIDSGSFLSGSQLFDSSLLEMNGGDTRLTRAFDSARIVQNGGALEELHLYDDSTFVMHDGFVNFGLLAYGKSRTLKNGGGITFLTQLFDEAVVTIRGGNVSEDIYVYDDARLHLYGFGLEFEISEEGEHYVFGRLADGTRVQSFFPADHQTRIILHEVPEPATWVIFAVGFATLMVGGRLRRG